MRSLTKVASITAILRSWRLTMFLWAFNAADAYFDRRLNKLSTPTR